MCIIARCLKRAVPCCDETQVRITQRRTAEAPAWRQFGRNKKGNPLKHDIPIKRSEDGSDSAENPADTIVPLSGNDNCRGAAIEMTCSMADRMRVTSFIGAAVFEAAW
jgi:hypothetical protein